VTFSYEDTRPRITARVDPALKRKVEEQPGTISEFVREALRAHLPADDDFKVDLPDDPQLAQAYRAVRRTVHSGWIDGRVLIGRLSQQFSMDKRSVRRHLLAPLCRRGYLRMQSDTTGRFVSYKVVHQ
jgi:DNA-binding transcriptional ArsR family regulator